MDENELLILGLLREQEQHGYQINEFIEQNLGRLTTMKRPTAYATLDRLHRQGFVSVRTEQPGNRAPRKVYALTPRGEERFHALLQANLATTHLGSSTDVGLLFLDHLPRDEVISALTVRLGELGELLAMHEQAPPHGQGLGVALALDHFIVILRAERDWLAATLPRLQVQVQEGIVEQTILEIDHAAHHD
jgi:DNA-binding PadR family transcriptional regulator